MEAPLSVDALPGKDAKRVKYPKLLLKKLFSKKPIPLLGDVRKEADREDLR
jgi:hypothetical protein